MNPVTLPRAWAPESQAVPERDDRRDGTGDAGTPAINDADGRIWNLQRRCSLSPCQFGLCFVALATLSGVVALFFWAQGARVVTYFAGVEVMALALAFTFHAVHAADGERLRLQRGCLLVERRKGLRIDRDALELSEVRVGEGADGAIELRVRGRSLRIGRHANVARRRQVLADLRQLVLQPVAARPVRT